MRSVTGFWGMVQIVLVIAILGFFAWAVTFGGCGNACRGGP
jgi:hypothetical protein